MDDAVPARYDAFDTLTDPVAGGEPKGTLANVEWGIKVGWLCGLDQWCGFLPSARDIPAPEGMVPRSLLDTVRISHPVGRGSW